MGICQQLFCTGAYFQGANTVQKEEKEISARLWHSLQRKSSVSEQASQEPGICLLFSGTHFRHSESGCQYLVGSQVREMWRCGDCE